MSTLSQQESSGTSSLADEGWVSWFCGLNGNHVFCEVEKPFMEDSFNLFGLKQHIAKDFTKVMNTMLDHLDPDEAETEDLSKSAAFLYGLIHARYITSTNGLNAMRKKFLLREFGECPRAYCNGQAVLPVGRADEPRLGNYSLFCPKCRDLYNCHPSQRHIDGAFFGTTFPHVFLMTFNDLVPNPPTSHYTPRLYGFRIHPSSSSVPQVNYYIPERNSAASAAAAAAALSAAAANQQQQCSVYPTSVQLQLQQQVEMIRVMCDQAQQNNAVQGIVGSSTTAAATTSVNGLDSTAAVHGSAGTTGTEAVVAHTAESDSKIAGEKRGRSLGQLAEQESDAPPSWGANGNLDKLSVVDVSAVGGRDCSHMDATDAQPIPTKRSRDA